MFKKNVLLLSFLLLVFSVEAQEIDLEKKTSFGITAGYAKIAFRSNSPFRYVLAENPGVGDSFFFGVFMDMPLGENFIFKPEVNYLFTSKFNGYLEIAPLLNYHLFNSGFKIVAGPQLKIITNEVADNYKRTGFELAGGLGYDFGRSWLVEAKYAHRLTNWYKDDNTPIQGPEMQYETFSVGVGLRF